MAQQIKLSLAPTVAPTSPGRPASSSSIARRDCATRPSTAPTAARKSASSTSASVEIQRARDLLRDVLLREDETDEILFVDAVREGLNEIANRLDSLAGIQTLFEVWNAS